MQININIQLDPGELAETLTRLAMLFAPRAPASEPPTVPPSALPSPDTPAPTSTPVLAAIAPATEATDTIAALGEWTPVTTEPERKAKPAAEKRPAEEVGQIEKRNYPSRLEFRLFDTLVRSEMKRLSMDRRIPSHSLWNAERDQRLPTLTAICQRYDAPNLVALAAKLDMLPPLPALNGQGYRKEPAT